MNITANLLQHCQTILELEVDPEISLVSQGATSMKLMQLVGKIYEEHNVIIDITDLMNDVSINSLASMVQQPEIDNVMHEHQTKTDERPLNDIQLTFWDMQEYSECKKSYNEGVSHLILGKIDLDICQQVLLALVERQPELRTAYYVSNGKPTQKVLEFSDIKHKLKIDVCDFRAAEDPMKSVELAHRELYTIDFDLEYPPNFKVVFWRIGAAKWVVSWVVFHIVTDWWAVDILRKEAAQIYLTLVAKGSKQPQLAAVNHFYPDFSNYPDVEIDREYWRSRFLIPPAEINLSNLKRPPIKSYKGEVHLMKLERVSFSSLDHLRKDLSVTMSSLSFAAFNLLACAISNQRDITTGMPFLNRQQAEIQNAVGIYVNSLPIRIEVQEQLSISEFIRYCHRELIDAYRHGRFPVRSIQQMLNKKKNLSRSPYYEQLFTYYENTVVSAECSELEISAQEIELPRGTCKYDITFFVTKQENYFHTKVEYSVALFSHRDISIMVEKFQLIMLNLADMADRPVGEMLADIRNFTQYENGRKSINCKQSELSVVE